MKEIDEMAELIAKTRKECPWDREQTIETMKKDLLEESDEIGMAIQKNDTENLKEEIGDLLWCIMLICRIAEDENLFTFRDVADKANEKIVRRHPHVFGDEKAETANDALRLADEVKNREKNKSC